MPPTDDKFAGVAISSVDKVLFRKPDVTKGELARYYHWVARKMLSELRDRPLMLYRCPAGSSSKCFYQKHHTDSVPFPTIPIAEKEGRKKEDYACVRSARDLLELVQLNTIEFHVWGSRAPDIESPDRIVFDLDPGNPKDYALVKDVALFLKETLSELGLKSFLRISGGKGLHVVVPIDTRYTWDEIRNFSEAVAILVSEHHPSVTANSRKAKRKDKVYLDYLRNGRGSTAIASYSVRARPGAPIAVPLSWKDLEEIKSFNFVTVKNARKELKKLSAAPWRGINGLRQRLPKIS